MTTTVKARVEWLRMAEADPIAGETVNVLGELAREDEVTVSSSPVSPPAAPVFMNEAGSRGVDGFARVSIIGTGAVIFTWDGSVPAETNGTRLESGQPLPVVSVESGQVLSFILASDQPVAAGGGAVADAAAEAVLGTTADAAYSDGTGAAAGTLDALLKGVFVNSKRLQSGTDRSGAITTGGAAQDLAAANTARQFLKGQNISAGDLWICESGAAAAVGAAGSYQVKAGLTFSVNTTRKISIIGAATGQAFTATEG